MKDLFFQVSYLKVKSSFFFFFLNSPSLSTRPPGPTPQQRAKQSKIRTEELKNLTRKGETLRQEAKGYARESRVPG